MLRWLVTRRWFQIRFRAWATAKLDAHWDYARGGHYEVPGAILALYGRKLFKLFGWQFTLHGFYQTDKPNEFHSHPSRAYRLVLSGGYVEELLLTACASFETYSKGETFKRTLNEGQGGWVYQDTVHRIDAVLPSSIDPRFALHEAASQTEQWAEPTFTLWISNTRNKIPTALYYPKRDRIGIIYDLGKHRILPDGTVVPE